MRSLKVRLHGSRSRMSDSLARFSWFVLWLRLTHNVGSSWFPPQEDVLNDRQYITRRLSALSLFSVLTLPAELLLAGEEVLM